MPLQRPEIILFDIDLTLAVTHPQPRIVEGVSEIMSLLREAGIKIGFITAGTPYIPKMLLEPQGIYRPQTDHLYYGISFIENDYMSGVTMENKAEYVIRVARHHGIHVPNDEDQRHLPQVWIVGDSVAELLAARESGCTVVTALGLLGEKGRGHSLEVRETYLNNASLTPERSAVIEHIGELMALFEEANRSHVTNGTAATLASVRREQSGTTQTPRSPGG